MPVACPGELRLQVTLAHWQALSLAVRPGTIISCDGSVIKEHPGLRQRLRLIRDSIKIRDRQIARAMQTYNTQVLERKLRI